MIAYLQGTAPRRPFGGIPSIYNAEAIQMLKTVICLHRIFVYIYLHIHTHTNSYRFCVYTDALDKYYVRLINACESTALQ